ncbi:MAG: hypothetical protein AAAB16_15285 [Pseudomonas sp.]|uniref:hypothetical protein n=1 Tax=Pseudomonas sp. TaxID=306 RepID=UPI0030F233C7
MGSSSKRLGSTVLFLWALSGAFSAYGATYVPKAIQAQVVPGASCEILQHARWGAETAAQGTQVFVPGGDISSLSFLNQKAVDPRTFYEQVVAAKKAIDFLQEDMSKFMRTRAFATRMNSMYERRFFRVYLQRADYLEASVGLLVSNLGRTLGADAAGYGKLYNVQPFNAQGDNIFRSMNVLSRKLVNVLTPAAEGCGGR